MSSSDIYYNKCDVNNNTCETISPKGILGREVNCLANFVPLQNTGNASELIYQYHISYHPEVDSKKFRMAILRQEVFHDIIEEDFIFDGMILYLPKCNPREVVVDAHHPESKQRISVRIKPNVMFERNAPQAITCYNIILRRCLELVGFKQLCRHFYNPAQATKVTNYDLEVWSGYETAIKQYENDLMLCIENRFKVLRTKTFLDILNEEKLTCNNKQQYQMKCEEKFEGQTLVTYYNNRMKRISTIEWDLNPTTRFVMADGQSLSLVDYYEQQYGRKITDMSQPIITCETKMQPNCNEKQKIFLVPELCQPTGITDEMLKDRRIMRALAVHMRLDPSARVKLALQLVRTIKKNEKCCNLLSKWKIQLSDHLVKLSARVLPPEYIVTASRSGMTDESVEWSRRMKREGLLRSVDLRNWAVVCPETSDKVELVNRFIDHVQRMAREMGIAVRYPLCIPVKGVTPNSYLSAIEEIIEMCGPDGRDMQVMVIFLTNEAKTTYDTVKKYLSVQNAVPSQFVLLNTLSGKPNEGGENKNFSSIVLKIFQQIMCKVGGALWKVRIPLKDSILIGYDLYHDSSLRGKTIGACVSTTDNEFTQFYSQTAPHENFAQLGHNLIVFVRRSLQAYYQNNDGCLPSRLFLYRDGVGDGQVDAVVEELRKICSSVGYPEDHIRLAFYIVTKKVNMRFYKVGNDVYKFYNPEPGTVVDALVTRPDRRDFFLVPQFVNQGTVTPVYYNILYDTTGLSIDKHELLSYKLCHMYYNWQGTVRVPALCQYAHKLAFFVAQSLHRQAHPDLNKYLYFL
ncbi:unnamed protein product [Auanema sp. JU1783]|nr:unnamed protein product [Auanema sp. JU1783]